MKTTITLLLMTILPIVISAQAKNKNVQHNVALKTTSAKVVYLKDKEFKCVLIAVMYVKVYPNIKPVPQHLEIMPVEDSELEPYHNASMQVVYQQELQERSWSKLELNTLPYQF